MKRYGIFVIFIILAIVLLYSLKNLTLKNYSVEAGPFVAYSMQEAERRLVSTRQTSHDIVKLGGITDIAGMVYDDKNRDLIIVGMVNEGKPKITLHDFVVAMRAVFVQKKTPLVSIDRTPETATTRKQVIRWEGGIENTKLGKDMLEADILLKEIALDKVPAEVWGVQSYFSMIAEKARKGKEEGHIASRFWFKNLRPSLAVREGVFAIMELDVGVETEVLYVESNGKRVQNLSGIRDEIGDMFAGQVAMNLSDLSVEHPVLARARPILALVSLSEGMKSLVAESELNYWLHEYKLPHVKTDEDYDLIEVKEEIEGRNLMLTVSGGIELNPIVVRLKKGHVTALKEAVLNSRPSKNTLIWHPPLEGWHIPGTENIEIDHSLGSSSGRKNGFSIDTLLVKTGQSTSIIGLYSPLPSPRAEIPKFNIYKNLPSQRISHDVGGVMLQGVAQISGSKEAKVDLTGGNFSLIVDGKNARLAPEVFRKFVTALWSVYYSNQDPGISIDPIAPRAKKHLVRYIGKVINNDLGRVMRKADYLMKKWAVGTERADISQFENPDDIAARKRILNIGAWSRFWFVPEDMRFKRGGDMLLFDSGRMTVKTEYMFKNMGERADPANEEFAQWFTENYKKITEKYPVYKELFEYAKMVSLAKYLKNKGIPLYWFLMANKDLVITEDSPGTVDALVKGSDYFRDIYIEGGVNLLSEGNYVYDQEAVDAIVDAYKKTRKDTESSTKMSVDEVITNIGSESLSFDLENKSYTVAPQHSLTSGKDRRGIRYQTDLALREKGFQLTKRSLDLINYDLLRIKFSKGLNQAVQSIPKHRLEAELGDLYKKIGKKVDEEADNIMKKLEKLLNHKYKTEDGFTKALENTLGEYRSDWLILLIKKHTYYNTQLELVRFFNPKLRGDGEFGKGWKILIPYRIRKDGDATREFMNVVIPETLALENLLTGEKEVLTFSDDRYASAGYVPDKVEKSQIIGLFLMTDASYRLADKLGNEFHFDQAWNLTDMIFSDYHHMHIEYNYNFTDAFDQAPYKIEPYSEERIPFLNVTIPRRLKVKDLVHGDSEVFVFSDQRDIAGYVPEDEQTSEYQFMPFMSDASYRLIDKSGNEVVINPGGTFKGMIINPGNPVVKSISQGNYKVSFKYTIDKSRGVIIASANLSEKGKLKPVYIVRYQYDDEGRLAKVERQQTQLTAAKHEPDKKIKMSKNKNYLAKRH